MTFKNRINAPFMCIVNKSILKNDDTNVLIQKLVYKGEKRFKTFLQMPIFNKQSKNNCQKLIKKPSHKTT